MLHDAQHDTQHFAQHDTARSMLTAIVAAFVVVRLQPVKGCRGERPFSRHHNTAHGVRHSVQQNTQHKRTACAAATVVIRLKRVYGVTPCSPSTFSQPYFGHATPTRRKLDVWLFTLSGYDWIGNLRFGCNKGPGRWSSSQEGGHFDFSDSGSLVGQVARVWSELSTTMTDAWDEYLSDCNQRCQPEKLFFFF